MPELYDCETGNLLESAAGIIAISVSAALAIASILKFSSIPSPDIHSGSEDFKYGKVQWHVKASMAVLCVIAVAPAAILVLPEAPCDPLDSDLTVSSVSEEGLVLWFAVYLALNFAFAFSFQVMEAKMAERNLCVHIAFALIVISLWALALVLSPEFFDEATRNDLLVTKRLLLGAHLALVALYGFKHALDFERWKYSVFSFGATLFLFVARLAFVTAVLVFPERSSYAWFAISESVWASAIGSSRLIPITTSHGAKSLTTTAGYNRI
jgi:hypothetical protein